MLSGLVPLYRLWVITHAASLNKPLIAGALTVTRVVAGSEPHSWSASPYLGRPTDPPADAAWTGTRPRAITAQTGARYKTAVQSQKAVSAYFTSKQIRHFVFAGESTAPICATVLFLNRCAARLSAGNGTLAFGTAFKDGLAVSLIR